jgi:methylated-DNA-[protein]-cysteine S-methyltransferase
MADHAAIRTTIPGPWGPFHLAATDRGIVAVSWLTTEAAFEAELVRRLRGPVVDARDVPPNNPRRAHLDTAMAALEAMLAGRPSRRPLRFDLGDRPPWDQRVLEAVAAIPRGSTASYGDIARQIGAPRAARAVGGAVGRNPVSLLIPCHRVIAGDGTIGGYGTDGWVSRAERLDMKRELLRREGVTVAAPDR